MAQRVEVVLIDDLDGGDAAETVTFSLDGVTYEIDLSDENARKLRDDFASWTGHARRAGAGGAKSATRRPGLDLLPRARRRDRRPVAAAQRVRAHRGLGGDVLAPVEEDLAGPQVLGHLPHDQLGVQLGQLLRELLHGVADLVARVRAG